MRYGVKAIVSSEHAVSRFVEASSEAEAKHLLTQQIMATDPYAKSVRIERAVAMPTYDGA